MKIKMLASFAGPDFTVEANAETDRFSDAEAIRMIEAGFAVPVSERTIERAVAKPAVETRSPPDHDGDAPKGGSRSKGSRKAK